MRQGRANEEKIWLFKTPYTQCIVFVFIILPFLLRNTNKEIYTKNICSLVNHQKTPVEKTTHDKKQKFASDPESPSKVGMYVDAVFFPTYYI